jgi:hypothetical protein
MSGEIMHGMSWRRLGPRVAAAVTAAAVISMSAFAVVAFSGGGGRDGGNSGGLERSKPVSLTLASLSWMRHGYGTTLSRRSKIKGSKIECEGRSWARSPPVERPLPSEAPQQETAGMSCPRQLLLGATPPRSSGAGIASSRSPLTLDHRGRGIASALSDIRITRAGRPAIAHS